MNHDIKFTSSLLSFCAILFAFCSFGQTKSNGNDNGKLPLDSVKAIAKEAYIYAYPMVDEYRIEYTYFVDSTNKEFKAPWNRLRNIAHVFTSDDKVVQTPNSDTPYSTAGLDLRAEPIVLTIPRIEKDRYFSIQLIDAYTYSFDYIGSRTTGNNGGTYMIAGPSWKGEIPKGFSKVFRSETELVLLIYRTQLFNAADIENVKKIQAEYKLQTLSAYLNTKQPKSVVAVNFIKPVAKENLKTSLEIFNVLNFLLQFCPTNPSEKGLMERFAKIGIGAGNHLDTTTLSPETKAAMKAAIREAWTLDFAGFQKQLNAGIITSGDLFGTRAHLKNNYLYRMGGAVVGINGNTKLEAMYPVYALDAEGAKLDGTTNKYTLHFSANDLPPVNAFWSLTMYELPSSLLVANPLNRYLLNSSMLPTFKRDSDGGLTFYIQTESPGIDKESNWLPAPKGPFVAVMRLYWPKENALDGTWKNPPMIRVK